MVQSPPETRSLAQLLARYREPNSARGVFELVITAVPLLVLWALIGVAIAHGYWIGLLLAVPAAGLLVLSLLIQHDCGHGSFFHGRLGQRLGRSRHRCPDAYPVLLLVTYPWTRSRQFGKSRPQGFWRHRHVDGAGVSSAVAVASAALLLVPASDGDVWHRSHLSVHPAASVALSA